MSLRTVLGVLSNVADTARGLLRTSLHGSPGNEAEWAATATAAAAAEVVGTVAAVAGQSHYVSTISGSYGAAQIGVLTLESPAGTVLASFHVHNSLVVPLERPLRIAAGAAVVARLTAGAAGVIGRVNLVGYTE